jgi:hypothetical protein
MKSYRKVYLAIALLALSLLIAFYAYKSESERQRESDQVLQIEDLVEESEKVEAEPVSVEISIYGVNTSRPGVPRFRRETHELEAGQDPIQMALRVVGLVLKQSGHIVPKTATVLQVYLLEDTAVVDLSLDTATKLVGGVEAEYGLLRSITRSLVRNIPEISQVRFLVGGDARSTFAGHVSIRQPFR